MHLILFLLIVSALLGAGPVLAHGGGLNAEGCHTNHKTGDYHCHRGAASKRTSRQSSYSPPSSVQPSRLNSQPLAPAGRAFRNCTEARAAGAAPVKRGDPGYGSHLDRDNDGIGCE